MKKYIVAFFALFMVVSANAQLRTSRTFKREKSNIEWILRAGVSIDQLVGDDVFGATTLWALDFGFNKPFSSSNCYWGMEIGFDTQGTTIEDDTYQLANIKLSPFTVGYKVAIGDKFKIDPHLGLYASYGLFEIERYWDDDDLFDFGLQSGVGVWYGRFNLDLMYQRGFIESSHSYWYYDGRHDRRDYYHGCTSNFLIRLGYRF